MADDERPQPKRMQPVKLCQYSTHIHATRASCGRLLLVPPWPAWNVACVLCMLSIAQIYKVFFGKETQSVGNKETVEVPIFVSHRAAVEVDGWVIDLRL